MRVCVIGTGYVGLVTGACLAHIGHEVICVDNDLAKVELMSSGQSPIYEPGLVEVMKSAMATGLLGFTTDLGEGVKHGEILFIAVGTPPLPDGSSNTRYVEAVAKGIGENLGDSYKVIVNKSTVPIGSGDWVKRLVLDGAAMRNKTPVLAGGQRSDSAKIEVKFDVVSNPEFLREGSAVYDTFNPDRIVLGSDSEHAITLMRELYFPIVDRSHAQEKNLPPVPVLTTDLGSAEMIKYAANAFLATKISFINEIANICDRVGADVTQVSQGIGLDSRIGGKFLNAGIGWGGSCFPKDVWALVHTAEDYGYESQLLNATIAVNHRQQLIVVDKLQQVLKILNGKTIGLLGLTFKPLTDDMRDATSLKIIGQLQRLGAKVKAYDPIITNDDADNQRALAMGLEGVVFAKSAEEMAADCDAIVLVTEWPEFLDLDYEKMGSLMHSRAIVDGRNFLSKKGLEAIGFHYQGIGV
jgi:UDPglucose 6-dehydrogenase